MNLYGELSEEFASLVLILHLHTTLDSLMDIKSTNTYVWMQILRDQDFIFES
jgi:hypothetical protein